MKESILERLNGLRIEKDNLTITLWGIEAFINDLEKALEEVSFEEE